VHDRRKINNAGRCVACQRAQDHADLVREREILAEDRHAALEARVVSALARASYNAPPVPAQRVHVSDGPVDEHLVDHLVAFYGRPGNNFGRQTARSMLRAMTPGARGRMRAHVARHGLGAGPYVAR